MIGPRRMDGYLLWVGGPVPPGAAAITLGGLVIVRRRALGSPTFERLLAHELVHVQQWRRLGWTRFLVSYLRAYSAWRIRGYAHWAAYARIPAEVEAEVLSGRAHRR